MILFRLLSFFLRVAGSLFFVFLLQIQFAGKTLESYLSDFGKKFIVTKTLQKAAKDGARVIKSFSSSKDGKKTSRQIAGTDAAEYIKNLTKKIDLPKDISPEREEEKTDSSD